MKQIWLSKRVWIALTLCLIISLLVRLPLIDYPVHNSESWRDYLVARHIVKYGERPLTGPCCLWNGQLGNLRHSAVYYYLIALPLIISDHPLFWQSVNILFQVAGIALVFLLAREMFGLSTAVAATLLFSLHATILKESQFVWQPHVMEPLLICSYLFLLLAYTRKSFWLLFWSVIIFVLAAVVHNAAFAVVPIYGVLVYTVAKRQRFPLRSCLGLGVGAGIWLVVLYLPWLYFVSVNHVNLTISSPLGGFLVKNVGELGRELGKNSQLLRQELLFTPGILLLVVLDSVNYWRCRKSLPPVQVRFWVILVGAVLLCIVGVSLFKLPMQSYYFTPLISLMVIWASETVWGGRSLWRVGYLVTPLYFIYLLYVSSAHFYFLKLPNLAQRIYLQPAVSALVVAIKGLQKSDRYPHPDFFRLKTYVSGIESSATADLLFWALLERSLGYKLLTVGDRDQSYSVITGDAYMFLVCYSYAYTMNEKDECITPFLTHYPQFVLKQEIHRSPRAVVFIAKKS